MYLWRLWRCWQRGGWSLLKRISAAREFEGRIYQSPWEQVPRSNREWQLEMPAFQAPVPDVPRPHFPSQQLLVGLGVALLAALVPLKAIVAIPFLFGIVFNPQADLGTPPWTDLVSPFGPYSQTFFTGSTKYTGSKEARITACNADAAAAAVLTGRPTYSFVSASMLPYDASRVTFNPAVRMIAESYAPNEWNVRAYGAAGDATLDDQIAIQTAISHANLGGSAVLKGGVVKFPAGKYRHTATLIVPVALDQGQVILRGDGMRVSYLFPAGPSTNFTAAPLYNACLLFGAVTPDAAGTVTNVTQYCGIENLSSSGTLITSGNVVGLQFTEMQKGFVTNSVIENFPNNSIGLYLRGSTVTGGLGTNTTAPHCWRNVFTNCVIVSIGSNNLGGQPVVLQNSDENSFVNGVHGATTGQTVSADSIFTTWIQMGRNNLFDDVLQAGERTALKTGYV